MSASQTSGCCWRPRCTLCPALMETLVRCLGGHWHPGPSVNLMCIIYTIAIALSHWRPDLEVQCRLCKLAGCSILQSALPFAPNLSLCLGRTAELGTVCGPGSEWIEITSLYLSMHVSHLHPCLRKRIPQSQASNKHPH